MSDLRELIEAIEAGNLTRTNWRDFDVFGGSPSDDPPRSILAHRAYHGSLDAALALMDSVLPDFAVERMAKWPGHPARVSLFGTHEARDGSRWHSQEDGRFEAEADTPARALLLAILRAMEAKEG